MSDPGNPVLNKTLLVPAFLPLFSAAIHMPSDQLIWGHDLQKSSKQTLLGTPILFLPLVLCFFLPTPALPRLSAPREGIEFTLSASTFSCLSPSRTDQFQPCLT